ncbi:MAG TPA: recombinase family protein [Leptolyngbyaceae cyanobacterium]|nr:recombinase family protein [Nostocaceae cyanobacterium]
MIYCRVSSNNQKDDLQSQTKAMEQFCLARGVANAQTLSPQEELSF